MKKNWVSEEEGERKTIEFAIHHMDTWIHRILQMRNKSRGSLFST
jgi:hypothetical protein